MKVRKPELLLLFYLLLPLKNGAVGQLLLCQVKAIHAARQAEKILDRDLENNTDRSLGEFLTSLWFDPSNALASAYLGSLAPQLEWFGHPTTEIRRKVARNQFECTKPAVDRIVSAQISIDEIKEAIANGELIEEFDRGDRASGYTIGGMTENGRAIHVKCGAYTRSSIAIIAAYPPHPERWDDNSTIGSNDLNHE